MKRESRKSMNIQNKTEILPTVVPDTIDDILSMQALYAGTGATIHIDISDGIFATGGKWNKPEELPEGLKFEVHLMVANPDEDSEAWLARNPVRVIFHHEACQHAVSLAEKIIDAKSIPAVAINLETPITDLEDIYPDATNFRLMAIETLGAQGAKFMPDVYKKISSCKELFPDAILSIDGGVSEGNAKDLVLCGASKLCVGSALSRTKDPKAEYKKFLAAVS